MNLAGLEPLEHVVLSGLGAWRVGEEARDVEKMLGPCVVEIGVGRSLVILGDGGRGRGRCQCGLLLVRRGNGRGNKPADDRIFRRFLLEGAALLLLLLLLRCWFLVDVTLILLVVLAGVAFLVLVDLVVAGWRRRRCYIGSAISANRALVSGEIRRRLASSGDEANRIKEVRYSDWRNSLVVFPIAWIS